MRTPIAALFLMLAGAVPILAQEAQTEERTTKTTTTVTTNTNPAVKPAPRRVVRHTRRTRRRHVHRHVATTPSDAITVHTVIRRNPRTRVRVIVP